MRANAPRQFGSAMPGNPRNLPLVGAPKKIATIAAGEGHESSFDRLSERAMLQTKVMEGILSSCSGRRYR